MSFGKFLAKAAALAAALAAIGAVLYKLKEKEDAKKAELDDYLMGDADETEVIAVGEIDSHLIHDLQIVGELKEGEKLLISFHVDGQEAKVFQEKLASMGVSSAIDSANNIADAMLQGPMSKEQMNEMAEALDAVSSESGAQYDGFTFE